MHEKDALEKHFFAYDSIFSEFWNRLVLDGGSISISPDELTDAPTEFVSVACGEPIKRMRDILKCYRSQAGLGIAYMGLENQTLPDRRMPIRVMQYDCMVYENQANRRDCSEKIIPVVTVVLYFGYKKPWTEPRTLLGCCDVSEDLRPLFNDYPIRVIELAWLSDEEIARLSGDLKLLALGLRCFRLKDLDRCPQGAIEHADALLSLLCKITGETEFDRLRERYKETEGAQMCEIFEEFRQKYRAEGFEQGVACLEEFREKYRAEGFEQGMACGEKRGEKRGKIENLRDMTNRIMALMGKTSEDAMNYLQLTDEEKRSVRQAF